MHVAFTALLVACSHRAPEQQTNDTSAAIGEVERLVQQGDAAFSERSSPEQLAAAVVLWRRALEWSPDSGEVLARLAHAAWFGCFSSADRSCTPPWSDREDRRDPCQPSDLVCRYWGARAASDAAWAASTSAGLRAGYTAEPVMRLVENAIPELDGAGATRWRAAWLSRIPTFAGRDLEEASRAFERALLVAPDCLLIRYERAAFLATAKGDRLGFLEDLSAIALAPRGSSWEPENAIIRSRAASLHDQIDVLFPPSEEPK